MFLFCCEKCAKKAQSNNPDFEIVMPVVIWDDVPECDICGEEADLLWCEDPED